MKIRLRYKPRLILYFLLILLAGGIWNLMAQPQSVKPKEKKEESYTRPKPTHQIRPVIPDVNRYQTDKVFLEYADSLYKLAEIRDEERQIVKGQVKFRQGGMFMYCDSEYYFPELNSLDAFGHVRMEQGDTLFVYADKLYYDGDARFARLRCGESEPKVRLINRNVTLVTDSLDYNLAAELGWYEVGGELKDEVNTLTSIYGEYSPSTKNAAFYYDVVLRNNKDDFTMLTDTLYYNTETHIASIVTPTRIYSPSDTILTSRGWYDTQTDAAELNSRSQIFHTDSLGRVTILEGDSILYDKQSRMSRAYMFRDRMKRAQPMVITDTARKAILIGGYGEYNDMTREALATDYPMLIEYSRGDTIFLRADTILSYIEKRIPKYFGKTESATQSRKIEESVLQPSSEGLSDSLVMIQDSMQIRQEKMLNDSILMHLTEFADDIIGDSVSIHDSKLISEGMPPDGFNGLSMPSDTNDTEEMLGDENIPQEFHVAKAFHRARFFRPDMQGVADSITFIEYDSMLYMNIKPIIWSGERQVYGNIINVHFNDSTADVAYLPDYGMMAEYVEEDFFNQLSGKKMTAYFENETLRRLEVDGNAQTIFLPMENDSTYNKLVNAESSYLTIDVNGDKMEKIKMWPDITGTVTPLFMVLQTQKMLPDFRWYESIRPIREWYGGRWQWADDLGEVPDELEAYFRSNDTGLVGRRKLNRTSQGESKVTIEGEETIAKEAASVAEEAESSGEIIMEEGNE